MAKSPKMQTWLKIEAGRRLVSEADRRKQQEAVEYAVERMMEPKNIRFEVRRDGKWEEITESELVAIKDA